MEIDAAEDFDRRCTAEGEPYIAGGDHRFGDGHQRRDWRDAVMD
jgi:hypothetical protein